MTEIGDIVRLHDSDTKASSKADAVRWCMVISTSGSMFRVTPRSTTVKGPVFTSKDLMQEFSKDGWFKRWGLPVPRHVVDGAQNIGQLPEPERRAVLALFERRSKR